MAIKLVTEDLPTPPLPDTTPLLVAVVARLNNLKILQLNYTSLVLLPPATITAATATHSKHLLSLRLYLTSILKTFLYGKHNVSTPTLYHVISKIINILLTTKFFS